MGQLTLNNHINDLVWSEVTCTLQHCITCVWHEVVDFQNFVAHFDAPCLSWEVLLTCITHIHTRASACTGDVIMTVCSCVDMCDKKGAYAKTDGSCNEFRALRGCNQPCSCGALHMCTHVWEDNWSYFQLGKTRQAIMWWPGSDHDIQFGPYRRNKQAAVEFGRKMTAFRQQPCLMQAGISVRYSVGHANMWGMQTCKQSIAYQRLSLQKLQLPWAQFGLDQVWFQGGSWLLCAQSRPCAAPSTNQDAHVTRCHVDRHLLCQTGTTPHACAMELLHQCPLLQAVCLSPANAHICVYSGVTLVHPQVSGCSKIGATSGMHF